MHSVKEDDDLSAFLLELSTDFARTDNPHELLCTAMVRLRRQLAAAQVTLTEFDRERGVAVLLRQDRADSPDLQAATLPFSPFESLGADARRGLVTVMREVTRDKPTASLINRWYGFEGAGAIVSAPLMRGGELVALLSVIHDTAHDWSAQEIELTRRVAQIVWPALAKARADHALARSEEISLDVTKRRKAEEALKDVNQRKDELLAMLAHELRNPLAPIRNAAQILRAHSTGHPELEWARSIIERQTRHLVRLVDDLLDVSRMVRGKIVLKKSTFQLAELVQHAVDTSQPLMRSRRHRLHVNLPAGSLSAEGDLIRLAQALSNLLNNAATYTDEGGQIWLDVWREAGQVVLRVRDTGPGVPPSLLPHVFDLFTQAERTLDRAQGGLGIGLTLVKLLVEMHAGSVEARNLSPRGAEFLVRLPADSAGDLPAAPRPAQAVVPSASEVHDKAMRILVVDDNVDAADSIALLLSLDGFEAQSVHGAMAALETVPAFKPDVLLLDIGLPVMDGYQVAKRLRAHIPVDEMRIVALSGYGQQADRDRAAQSGFDDYLVKPVEPTALTEFLRSLQ